VTVNGVRVIDEVRGLLPSKGLRCWYRVLPNADSRDESIGKHPSASLVLMDTIATVDIVWMWRRALFELGDLVQHAYFCANRLIVSKEL
jgi:hypothetical protein